LGKKILKIGERNSLPLKRTLHRKINFGFLKI
jgi:hypothetical protein